MERCDFCSVTTILRNYISEAQELNQIDFVSLLFDSYLFSDPDITFDSALVNRWLNGAKKLSPAITSFYSETKNHNELQRDLREGLFPKMYDSFMAAKKIYELLLGDASVSEEEKQKLIKNYSADEGRDVAAFIADVLCFCLTRTFVKRDSLSGKQIAEGKLSPILSGFVFSDELPYPCRYFCGRSREIAQIRENLNENGKLFLSGIAGIGKSELAKAYARQFREDYTNILYLSYSGSLFQDIADLDFADDRPFADSRERFRSHNRFFRVLGPDTLIIVDNFNTSATADSVLPVVMKYRCHILFTTRSHMENYPSMQLDEISDKDTLLDFMGKFYSDAKRCPEILKGILEAVHCHTLAVELAARLLEKGILSPKRLLKKLRQERTGMNATDQISILKDGRPAKETYYGHIHTLFALFRLTEEQQDIMRCMALFPATGLSFHRLADWIRLPDMNAVNDLTELGLIMPKPGRTLALHPMIQEISVTDLKPSFRSCHVLFCRLHATCLFHGREISYFKLLFQTIENAISLAQKDDLPFYLRFLEDVYPYMEKYQYADGMQLVLSEMSKLIKEQKKDSRKDLAMLLDYQADQAVDRKEGIRLREEALSLLPDINAENVLLVSNIHANLGAALKLDGQLDAARRHMEAGLRLISEYNLPWKNDTIAMIMNYAVLLCDLGEAELGMRTLHKLARSLKEWDLGTSQEYALVCEVMGNISLLQGKISDGTNCFKKALEIYEKIWEGCPEMIAEKKQELQGYYPKAGACIGREIRAYLKNRQKGLTSSDQGAV